MTCISVPPGSVVVVGVRQQGQEARALDGGAQLTRVVCLGAGQAGRDDLAVCLDEIAQGVQIFVVDLFDAGGGEAAELATLEQRVLLREFAFFFAFSEESHDVPLSLVGPRCCVAGPKSVSGSGMPSSHQWVVPCAAAGFTGPLQVQLDLYRIFAGSGPKRSEEHTPELQSRGKSAVR